MSALLDIFGRWKLYAIAAGVFLSALVAAYVKGQVEGRASAKSNAAEAARKAVEKAKKVQTNVASQSDAVVHERLNGWMRD